jgi:hypothetical protein
MKFEWMKAVDMVDEVCMRLGRVKALIAGIMEVNENRGDSESVITLCSMLESEAVNARIVLNTWWASLRRKDEPEAPAGDTRPKQRTDRFDHQDESPGSFRDGMGHERV